MERKYTLFYASEGKLIARNDSYYVFVSMVTEPYDSTLNEIGRYHRFTYDEYFDYLQYRIDAKNKILKIELDGKTLAIDSVSFDEFSSATEKEIVSIDESLTTDQEFVSRLEALLLKYDEVKDETMENIAALNTEMYHRQHIKRLTEYAIMYYDQSGKLDEFDDLKTAQEVYDMLQSHGTEFTRKNIKTVNERSNKDLRRLGICSLGGAPIATALYGCFRGSLSEALSYGAGTLTVTAGINIVSFIKNSKERKKLLSNLIMAMENRYGIGEDGKIPMKDEIPNNSHINDGPKLHL